MNYRILIVSSIPLSAPWNGADKNLAHLLVQNDHMNQYRLNTGLMDEWPENVIPDRSRKTSPMPTIDQKIRAFGYLAYRSASVDGIHMVASLSHPSRISSSLLRVWKAVVRRPVIHTVPSIGDIPVDPRNFIGDMTIVVSEYSRKKLTEHGIPNVYRIYPPIDDRVLRPAVPPEQVAQSLALGQRAILYPAHYGPDSGIREITQAFANLPGAFQDAVLVLACRTHPSQDAGEEAQKVMEYAKELGVSERVRIIGNFHDMPALISACSLTALVPGKLSSKMDLPLVVLESLILKRPVVISDQPPMDEALLGGGGFHVKYGDVRGLSGALAQLLSDPNLRQKLALQGYQATIQRCHPLQIVKQYNQFYQQLFGGSKQVAGENEN